MRHIGASETAALLPYSELASALAETLLEQDKLIVPARSVTELGHGALLLLMPASDENLAITKLVTLHPNNAALGKPTVQSDVLVMDARTGERLGLLEGSTLTARRTAALSLLAVKTLAGTPQGPLLIVGAGVEGRAHLEAFHEGLGVREVVVASRTELRAQALADHATSLGLRARTVTDPDEAARDCPLIVTATTSPTPVLHSPLNPGTVVCAVGAFQPECAELAPAIIAESLVVVDTEAGARAEAGDLIQAAAEGVWTWGEGLELRAALSRPPKMEKVIIFKSVGHALFDLAACRLAFGQRGSQSVL
jgi:1-piperideine-2-carboxylate/1-pyrroline-2-carboxylate reductase [NAD(P)H]